jgi:ferric-dicitrate binding protein FerR (iron transport regulator)
MNNDKYIEKWLNNSLSEEEQRVFENTKDYQKLKKLDEALLKFKAPEYDVQGELERINKQKAATGKVVKVSWFQPMVRAAAVIVMIIIGYLLIFKDSVTIIESGIAQKTEFFLPDNSEVMLNASSTISYVEKQWQEHREVKLRGEAYFNVAKGSKFDVITTTGVVTVLGTQFNVKVRDNYFEVRCYEGLVAVNNESEIVKLPPNHMFRIVNGKIITESNLKDTAPSWLDNESSFISVPYEQVINELERQYNVVITTNEVDLEQLFTGRFTHNDISLALKSITLPFNLRYELEEDQHIVLSSDNQ